MVAVFVHGVPETPEVWDPIVSLLHRTDVLALRLPGFGEAAPKGFGATKEEYTAWLIDELGAIGEPVDAVGHDWGGGFVLRVACTRPDLVRCWVSDVAGILDPAYVWHDLAQIWQTPGAGEQYFAETSALDPAVMIQAYARLGITPAAARAFVEAADVEMARCILALYRSATQPRLAEWLAVAPAAKARPGLVVAPSDDPYTGGPMSAVGMAPLLGAQARVLDGLGHWWMLQDPRRGADVLEAFWAEVDQLGTIPNR
jgi:pimeloyl-ACP methyl ester carboxylesterase